MGHRETTNSTGAKSESACDDASITAHDASHPLARKGYDIGPASATQVGDVFEFLWADAHEYQWEWKCLGYTRFIVLRHSDTFPHHCVCIPICMGSKHEFAKPGIDASQQGYVFADGTSRASSRDRATTSSSKEQRDRRDSTNNSGNEKRPRDGNNNELPRLPFSPIGVELRPGKLRVKDDSRANYADMVEIDHDAQIMIVGNVARYFDRVRRNVNKAYLRQILKTALTEYRAGKSVEKYAKSSIQPSEVGFGSGETTEQRRRTAAANIGRERDSRDGHGNGRDGRDGRDGSGYPSMRSPRKDPKGQSRESLATTIRSRNKSFDARPLPVGDVDYDLESMRSVAMAGSK